MCNKYNIITHHQHIIFRARKSSERGCEEVRVGDKQLVNYQKLLIYQSVLVKG